MDWDAPARFGPLDLDTLRSCLEFELNGLRIFTATHWLPRKAGVKRRSLAAFWPLRQNPSRPTETTSTDATLAFRIN